MSILPPKLFKNLIKSFTSGSIAQFLSTVLPFALNAASIAFSVAPTEMLGNLFLLHVIHFLPQQQCIHF